MMTDLIKTLRRLAAQANLAKVCDSISFDDDDWDESKHPRGNPKNAGQFTKKGQGHTSSSSYSSSTHDWHSRAFSTRLQEGWTTNPKGVSSDELYALEALVPEKHHEGSESHGRDVILTNMYPPDYAQTPIVRFVKQFNGNKEDLKDIRQALYLIHGGDTNNRARFDKTHLPDLSNIKPYDKAQEQKWHDTLLARERKVYAKRQATQKKIGYPSYLTNSQWKDLDAEYNRIHKERLAGSPDKQRYEAAVALATKAWKDSEDARFSKYRNERIEKGYRLLDEVASRRGVKPLSSWQDGVSSNADNTKNSASTNGTPSGIPSDIATSPVNSGTSQSSQPPQPTHNTPNAPYRNPHITPEQDAAYTNAIEKGDKDTALRMVREAAAKAMPNTKVVGEDGLPMVVYHGSRNKFNQFDLSKRDENRDHQLGSDRGFWFTSNYRGAERYGKIPNVNTPLNWNSLLNGTPFNDKEDYNRFGAYLFSLNTPQTNKEFFTKRDAYFDIQSKIDNQKISDRLASQPNVYSVFLNSERPQKINGEFVGVGIERDMFLDSASRLGDGAIIYNADMGGSIGDEYIVFSPSQIKSADITYDDNGKLIPLSQRFNPNSDDIRE